MSIESFEPISIDSMGGLVSLVDGADCPLGCSPDCRDVQYVKGSVRTRPGLSTVQQLDPSAAVTYLKTFIDPNLVSHLLMFDSTGSLWYETGVGTKTLIVSTFAVGSSMMSVTAFGKEWIAESDGRKGRALPLAWDGTALYLVGNQPPAVGALAAVDSATVGNIVAGIHQLVVYFESASGYLSKPCAAVSWTAAGAFKVAITGIPVWPATAGERPIVARRVAVTASGGSTFYHILSTMRIADNVTTTLTLDFTDTAIVVGDDISALFRNEVATAATEFQGQLGVISYARRLFWFGGNPLFGVAFRSSLVRVTRADDPESFDSTEGIMQVSENDGQGIRSGFEHADRLYFVKERSLHSTEDDGLTTPNNWRIVRESATVGTPSVHGVGIGPGWVVIANRSGLYYFQGGEPVKISQEIQPTWDAINWEYAHLLWVTVDTEKKRIYVGAPFCTGIFVNVVLTLDYQEGILIDPIDNGGRGRKWSPWLLRIASGEATQRTTKAARMVFGSAENGRVMEVLNSATSDDGALITNYYRTAYIGRLELGRVLFGYMSSTVRGSGMLLIATHVTGGTQTNWNPATLANPALADIEKTIDVQSERVSFRFGTAAIGAWFSLVKFCGWWKSHPWSKMRGTL